MSRNYSPISKETLEDFYLGKGFSIATISKKIGRAQSVIMRFMKLHQIPSRPQHQWQGRKHKPESVEKTRRANLGSKRTTTQREALSAAHLGKVYDTSKRIVTQGYVKLYKPKHPMADSGGYVPEHRFVLSETLGRLLEKHEIVHHINGVKNDNCIENLVITSRSEHSTHHNNERSEAHGLHMQEVRKNKFWSTKKNTKN